MRQAKVVLFGGGGYFNDAWPDMLRSMYVAIEMAKASRTPVVVYGQTVGPFSDKTISDTLANALNGVTRVAYRDIQSKRVLDKAGVPENKCVFTADEANLIAFKAWQRPKELNGVKVLVGVMTQEFRPHLGTSGASPKGRIGDAEAYERELVKTLVELNKTVDGVGFLFIPSTTWDEKQCARIHEKTRRCGIEKSAFLSNSQTKDFIGACQSVDVMLSTNMHPIILAATAARPCIAISYHYKLDDYMASIGLEEFVVRIDAFDSISLCSKIVRAIDQRPALSSIISQKHRLVRAKASHNLSALREAMQ
jgi:polysaccharide pyruvyl transferase WcaK-like protein